MGSTGWLIANLMAIIGFVCAIILVPRIIMERRQVGATLAWLLIICLVPYVGVPLFFLIGGHKVKRLQARKKNVRTARTGLAEPVKERLNRRAWGLSSLMVGAGAFPPRRGNSMSVYADGMEAYDEIMKMADEAERRIDVCTYILGKDAVGRAIIDKLAERAADGVEVRLLVDGVGSFGTKGRFARPLREAGGKVGTFLPVIPVRRKASAHLRNHRKIVVVDGRSAFVGGMNLSSQFMGPRSDQPRWKDVSMRLDGPVARDLHEVFQADWEFTTGEVEAEDALDDFPEPDVQPEGSVVQIAPDGPDTTTKPIYSGVMAAVAQAEERIWVATPFYVPDESLARLLALAARMGRDVRLIVPEKSNMRLADLAGRSYLDGLMEAGAQVFLYRKGLLHAKLLVVDDVLAGVGSFNVDMRSFYLNFEIGAFLYSPESIAQIADTIFDIQKESELVKLEEFTSRGRTVRFAEDLCRLFSPLL